MTNTGAIIFGIVFYSAIAGAVVWTIYISFIKKKVNDKQQTK